MKKTLGVFSLIMINVVAVDSLRSLPFSAEYGFSLISYYLLGAVCFLIPVALVAAELATGWPNKGGIYVWVRQAFGERWAFVVIWLEWIYNVVWYPTILSFIAGAIAYLIQPSLAQNKTYMLTMVTVVFWGATFINFFGMRLSSAVSTIGALVGTLIPMILIIILGIVWISQHHPIQIQLTEKSLLPDFSHYRNLAFLTAVLFGLVGIEMSTFHADEVKDPGKAYPRAILISTIIILTTLILSSLAISAVVPHSKLNIITGLLQAFQLFFLNYHLQWLSPIITICIVIGGIGGVATWIIGPTKGLLTAARDGSAPPLFAKVNKRDVPIVILLLQALVFTLLCSVYLIMPTVKSSYWALTAMTAQLAMLVYIIMFAAGIRLRYKYPDKKRSYKIPGNNLTMILVGLIGTLTCIATIILGFIPPAEIQIGSIARYETILILGILLFTAPPLVIYSCYKSSK